VKRCAIVLFALVMTSFAVNSSVAGTRTPRIDHRQARQEARIRHGWRNGELTRHEARRLRAGQQHVRRMERRAMRDGMVTLRERRAIARAQVRESRAIYRTRHNHRVRT